MDENLAIPGPSGLNRNRFDNCRTKRRIVHDSDSSDSDVAQNHYLFNPRASTKRMELRQSDAQRQNSESISVSDALSAPDLQLDCFDSSSDAEQSDSDSVIFVDEDKKVSHSVFLFFLSFFF